MSQSASAHRNQSSSSNNNEKQQQPSIIELDSDDDDDDDDVMLLETFPPPPPRPVACLVKTDGPLDYQDDCFCLKCRMIKEFLVKVECEPNDCTCKECMKTDTARQNGVDVDNQQQSQAHNGDPIKGNEVAHPQAPLEPTDNAPQPEAALSPENDDDERYSRSSTPEFDPFNDDDDDEEEADEDGNEELDEGDGRNDSSGTNPKMPTSSAYNKKDIKANPNECPFCKSKAHNSTSSMSTHYRVAHLNWKPYYCKWTNCAFESGYSKAVETHVKWKHMKTESTSTKQNKQQNAAHYVGKHNEDKQPTDKLLSDHLLKNTGIKWPVTSALEPTIPSCTCTECGRRFARPDLLECHVESHDSAGFRCTWPNCGYFYSGSVTAAKLHICHDHLGSSTEYSLRDMKEAKKYLQPVGGESTSGPSSSATASNTQVTQPTTSRFASTNQNDDEYDGSDYDYDNDGSSDASSSSHQSSQDELPEPINGEFICPHTNCLKRFPTQSRFKLHMITHTSQKPFKCSCCSFKANSESNLAKHFRRDHREKKLFRCAFPGCTYGNSVYSEVTQHIRLAHTAVLTKSRNLKKTLNKYVERRYLAPKRQ